MVREATITCGSCDEEFTFDFDSEEFRDYGGAECPHCGYENDDLDLSDYVSDQERHRPKEVPHATLERHQCSSCDEIFGVRPEFGGEINCPYCGAKYE